MAEDRFNLVVVGRFSRGKTSLMNAILRTDRLPTGITPLTSVITAVGYGSKEQVVLTYDERIMTREFPIETLPLYITQQGNPGNVQRIRTAEVQLPAEILRRGFYFVDTPGLGSVIVENTLTTRAFLPEADAFVLVSSYESPLAEEELRFLNTTVSSGRRVFVVLNKHDTVGPEDRQSVLAFVHEQLQPLFENSAPPIFSVSARDAFAAALTGDASALSASGIPEFEEALVRFLLEEKSSQFLQRTCERVRALLHDLANCEGPALLARIDIVAQQCRDYSADDRVRTARAAMPATRYSSLHQLPACSICAQIAEKRWDFLRRYQYEIVTKSDERQSFAHSGGFCAFHTWEYGALASPYGTCAAYPPLLERLAEALRTVARGVSPRDDLADRMRDLLPGREDCALCRVRDQAEAAAIDTAAKQLLDGRAGALNSLSAICLPHATMLAQSVGDLGLVQSLAKRQATICQRMAEDMRRYALKHDAARRTLETREEETVARRALLFLAGHRNVVAGNKWRTGG